MTFCRKNLITIHLVDFTMLLDDLIMIMNYKPTCKMVLNLSFFAMPLDMPLIILHVHHVCVHNLSMMFIYD